MVAAAARGRRGIIPAHVDAAFRNGVREACYKHGGKTALRFLDQALGDGPARDGLTESIKFFGNELDTKLRMTAQIVEGLEITMPGFAHWLMLTGFGNDKTMIRAFVAWAEYSNTKGKVDGEIMERHVDTRE
jgi:hypothetical protein